MQILIILFHGGMNTDPPHVKVPNYFPFLNQLFEDISLGMYFRFFSER